MTRVQFLPSAEHFVMSGAGVLVAPSAVEDTSV